MESVAIKVNVCEISVLRWWKCKHSRKKFKSMKMFMIIDLNNTELTMYLQLMNVRKIANLQRVNNVYEH